MEVKGIYFQHMMGTNSPCLKHRCTHTHTHTHTGRFLLKVASQKVEGSRPDEVNEFFKFT
jgi:hypothetical protein